MCLSSLAQSVYNVLRTRVPSPTGQITYGQLSNLLPAPFTGIDPHLGLSEALGEIVLYCQAIGLQCIRKVFRC